MTPHEFTDPRSRILHEEEWNKYKDSSYSEMETLRKTLFESLMDKRHPAYQREAMMALNVDLSGAMQSAAPTNMMFASKEHQLRETRKSLDEAQANVRLQPNSDYWKAQAAGFKNVLNAEAGIPHEPYFASERQKASYKAGTTRKVTHIQVEE